MNWYYYNCYDKDYKSLGVYKAISVQDLKEICSNVYIIRVLDYARKRIVWKKIEGDSLVEIGTEYITSDQPLMELFHC